MPFDMLKYNEPDLKASFLFIPNVLTECVKIKGVAPENYHATRYILNISR